MGNVVIKDMGKGKFAIKGVCEWAKVFTPDTKFNENGKYSIDILLDEEDATTVREAFGHLAEEALAKAVKEKPALKKQAKTEDFIKEVFDDEGEVTGYKIQIKQDAKVISGDNTYEFDVKVKDAQGNEMDGSQLVGNGSTVVVLFEPRGYFMQTTKTAGVSLKRMSMVKVLDLVEFDNYDPLAEFEGDFVADNKGAPADDKKKKAPKEEGEPTSQEDDSGEGEDDDDPFN